VGLGGRDWTDHIGDPIGVSEVTPMQCHVDWTLHGEQILTWFCGCMVPVLNFA